MRFYISGALQGSSDLDPARALYETAGVAVQRAGAKAYVPHLKTDPEKNVSLDSQSVFETDLNEIKNADGLIVFLNEPSLGVGAEIAIALSLGKNLLPVLEHGKNFSRFVGGLLEANGIAAQRYTSPDELSDIISAHVIEQLGSNNINHLISAI